MSHGQHGQRWNLREFTASCKVVPLGRATFWMLKLGNSHCAKECDTMSGIVDRHSNRASSEEVSEKPWWSYKRQWNDRKCAATVGILHSRLCCNS